MNKKLDVYFYVKDISDADDVGQNHDSVVEYKILALKIFNFFADKEPSEK